MTKRKTARSSTFTNVNSNRSVFIRGRIPQRTIGEFLISILPVNAWSCSITRSQRLFLTLTLLVLFDMNALAQSSIITTYAGRSVPINGAQAVTQPIGRPFSVISDGDGGFYMASWDSIARVTANGVLTVIAGNGTTVSSGDGGPAAAAGLSSPRGLALDRAGNLFVAESSGHRIRKVSPDGVITTVAGNGTPGFGGDGGPATAGQLNQPTGVALDAHGNLFIADSANRRIRKVAPDGVISTVAGNGVSGFSGDGGAAVSASLGEELGIAVDAKANLLIADARNHRVRQVTPEGIINTVAIITKGPGVDGNPAGIAVDEAGNLFVADSFFQTIWKNPQDALAPVAGPNECRLAYVIYGPCIGGFSGDGGPATAALLNYPTAVAVDAAGNLFIADWYNNRIRKVTPDGIIRTVAGNGIERFSGDNGPATAALLYSPNAVAVDTSGNLFIVDRFNYRVRKVTPEGVISTAAGDGTPGLLVEGFAVDTKGNLWIAEYSNHRIRKVSPEGVNSTVAGNGRLGFSGDDGPATNAQLYFPRGIAVDAQGNLFIADSNNRRIRKVTPAGVITTVAGDGSQGFSGDGGSATSAALNLPSSVAVDAQGNLFIGDIINRRVRKVTPAGVISTVAGNGATGFSGDGGPATSAALGVLGIAVDAQGNLFIAGDNRIRKVTPDGVIRTVAGIGIVGFSGDGGPATSAALNGPTGIAVDAQGNIFIADTGNHRVRKVSDAPFLFSISERGGALFRSPGTSEHTRIGYARIESGDGRPAPSGLAMIGFRRNGVLVSEAGIAASAPIRFGRVYAEIQGAVNTGLAMANPSNEAALVVYYFTDRNGTLRPGSTTIPPNGQIAAQLHEPPFNGGASLNGSFTFIASVPIAVAAIRTRTNARGDWLMTALPVDDLGRPPLQQTVVIPHFAAGGGWTTEIVLVNRTDSVARGTVRFRSPSAHSATVRVGDSTSDTFTYSVAPGASEVLRTTGVTSNIQTGSVAVLPEPNTTAPTAAAIFSHEDGGVMTSEVGVPAVAPATEFRLYAEAAGEFGRAGSIQTALAVANTSANAATVTLELHHLNGSSTGLLGSLQIPANGQTALFLYQVPGFRPLPADFQGILRASATTPISLIGLRARHNERGDLLMAAMPPAPEGAASTLFFPHIADSGGYTTEFIVFSGQSGQAASGALRFVSQSGVAWNLSMQPAGSAPAQNPEAGNAAAPLQQRGLRLKTGKATPGYILFTPLASDTTYLVDNDGQAVRTWKSDLLPSAWVYMKDNGNIVRGGRESNTAGIGGGGPGGRFQEFTFDGELVWDFSFNNETHLPHHDAVILPNGNVLAIVWEVKTAEEARKAGRLEGFIPERGVWPDMLVEFEPQPPNGAKIVWEWHSWDHLIQNVDPQMNHYGNPADHPERIDVNGDLIGTTTPPRNPTSDIHHTNSVAYNPELDQILLSVPRFNEVWVIDHSTTTEQARGSSGGRSGKGGDLLYRWGNPQAYGRGLESDRLLGFQHDARWIPRGRPGAGNITVFSNRTPGPDGVHTKVYEFVPPVDAGGNYFALPNSPFKPAGPVWTYSAESLDAANVSGAERLANGLTLISSGPYGRIFEVTPAGEIVWEYWSPYSGASSTQGAGSSFILFRAVRIPADHPAVAGRRLQAFDPQPP